MKYCLKKCWYVLRVRSRAEHLVHLGLVKKDFEILYPTYQTFSPRRDRKKILNLPIFSGYMFVKTLMDAEKHLNILKTPGVVEILRSNNGPTPVPNEQIENIRLLESHVGNFFLNTKFDVGDEVFVREGPLRGLRGIVDRLDKKKLHIHVDAIPGSVMIEIDPSQLQLERDEIYSALTN